ncbi:hypothetical protein QLH51_04145 [Sphingomonas sp. 2R-10]|uniref:hypothetical protein n=1 Tax=Sphingomonas sp. 2R-10 TaxID=3045148 RepID=UPI0024B8DA7C|nr:hypothetical protein [Sphingomonas sp. 2R-10]MDJ0275995.1 hypothetical protein [Sphingomonas sp. 2R-10]
MSDATLVNVNTATADELDAVPELKGHGFEICVIVRIAAHSPTSASSMRCLVLPERQMVVDQR